MTIDEAIRRCEEIVKENQRRADTLSYDQPLLDCVKCAEEHRQLAEWLKLLKRILDSGDCNECGIKKYCQVVPPLGEQVRYNCPLFVRKEQEEGEQERIMRRSNIISMTLQTRCITDLEIL